jgi:hypothetical protein
VDDAARPSDHAVTFAAMETSPYRRCDPPVPVVVTVPGVDDPFPGFAEGWRGDMVKVNWTSGTGLTHTGFIPAAQVTRITEPLQDVTPPGRDART